MIIIGIIAILIGFILSIVIILKDQVDKLDLIGVYSSVAIMVGGTMMICENNCPQAIDVYRGKTTLQITYKGNTPIDTTVVYK